MAKRTFQRNPVNESELDVQRAAQILFTHLYRIILLQFIEAICKEKPQLRALMSEFVKSRAFREDPTNFLGQLIKQQPELQLLIPKFQADKQGIIGFLLNMPNVDIHEKSNQIIKRLLQNDGEYFIDSMEYVLKHHNFKVHEPFAVALASTISSTRGMTPQEQMRHMHEYMARGGPGFMDPRKPGGTKL